MKKGTQNNRPERRFMYENRRHSSSVIPMRGKSCLFLFWNLNSSTIFSNKRIQLFIDIEIPLLGVRVCLRSIPYFFSVEDCQGLTPQNNLHTLCSDEPRGEGNMMSLPTNNNHPASPLTSTSPGYLATPQLSPLRAPPSTP